MTAQGGTDRPAFDPRHDARFQRGYRPGDALPAADHADHGAVGVPADGSEDPDALAFNTDIFPDEPDRPRWNPFIVLLWLIGIALPVGGLALQWQSVNGMFGNNTYSGNGEPPFAFVLQQLGYLNTPSLISTGILIMAGLLLWHASVWRAGRRGSAGR